MLGTDIEVETNLMTIQQGQLIDEHSTQSEATGGYQSFGGYTGMSIEYANMPL